MSPATELFGGSAACVANFVYQHNDSSATDCRWHRPWTVEVLCGGVMAYSIQDAAAAAQEDEEWWRCRRRRTTKNTQNYCVKTRQRNGKSTKMARCPKQAGEADDLNVLPSGQRGQHMEITAIQPKQHNTLTQAGHAGPHAWGPGVLQAFRDLADHRL